MSVEQRQIHVRRDFVGFATQRELPPTGRFLRQGVQSLRRRSDADPDSNHRRNRNSSRPAAARAALASRRSDAAGLVITSIERVLPIQWCYDADAVSIWCK